MMHWEAASARAWGRSPATLLVVRLHSYKQDIDKSLRVHTAIASPSAGRHEHV